MALFGKNRKPPENVVQKWSGQPAINVRKIPLPATSALKPLRKSGHFVDCYTVTATMPVRQAAEIVVDFPLIPRLLLRLRNLIAARFGLKHKADETTDSIGMFPVHSETDQEIIAGFDDKHLDFRLSVMVHGDQIRLATWVAPHNIGGRLYLWAILPFHIYIVRNGLVRVARAA